MSEICHPCPGRDDDFERTKKTDFKGEYQGLKEEPVVSLSQLLISLDATHLDSRLQPRKSSIYLHLFVFPLNMPAGFQKKVVNKLF